MDCHDIHLTVVNYKNLCPLCFFIKDGWHSLAKLWFTTLKWWFVFFWFREFILWQNLLWNSMWWKNKKTSVIFFLFYLTGLRIFDDALILQEILLLSITCSNQTRSKRLVISIIIVKRMCFVWLSIVSWIIKFIITFFFLNNLAFIYLTKTIITGTTFFKLSHHLLWLQ